MCSIPLRFLLLLYECLLDMVFYENSIFCAQEMFCTLFLLKQILYDGNNVKILADARKKFTIAI